MRGVGDRQRGGGVRGIRMWKGTEMRGRDGRTEGEGVSRWAVGEGDMWEDGGARVKDGRGMLEMTVQSDNERLSPNLFSPRSNLS